MPFLSKFSFPTLFDSTDKLQKGDFGRQTIFRPQAVTAVILGLY